MSVRALVAATIVVAGVAASGCHHAARTANVSAAENPDSITGIVSVTGTSYEQRIVLQSGDQVHPLTIMTGDSLALARLGGAEVVAWGSAADSVFRVGTFTVTSIDHAPVADGVLQMSDGHYTLRTRSADLALGNPPAALDSLVGARIWVSGPLDTGPNSFGIIAPASSP